MTYLVCENGEEQPRMWKLMKEIFHPSTWTDWEYSDHFHFLQWQTEAFGTKSKEDREHREPKGAVNVMAGSIKANVSCQSFPVALSPKMGL